MVGRWVWPLGGSGGPCERPTGQARLDLSGQRQASRRDSASHCHSELLAKRAHPTSPRASANSNPDGGASRAGLELNQAANCEQREGLGSLWDPRRTHAAPEGSAAFRGSRPGPGVCGCSSTRAYPGLDAESAPRRRTRWFTAGSTARTGTKRVKGVGGSRELWPHIRPAARTGLYLHVTQLHAQIQLAVSLSPVDVRRQHLILHGHTARGAGRRIDAACCLGSWETGAGRTQATIPCALERGQPPTSRQPTLASCACAVRRRGAEARALDQGASRAGAKRRAEGGKGGPSTSDAKAW